MLMHPGWRCSVFALCRANDPDRSPRFFQALRAYRATGGMADLDDSPDQPPLPASLVEQTVLSLVEETAYDLLLTHGLTGEYTRHLRHSETFRAVAALWEMGALRARELWLFAYEDGGGAYPPRARIDADLTLSLPKEIRAEKYRIMREVYGFSAESWEARATPEVEAFHCFKSPQEPAFRVHRKEQVK